MPIPLTIETARRKLRDSLQAAGIEFANLEASIILSLVTGLDRSGQILNPSQILTKDNQANLDKYTERRLSGEPLDNIIGHREFYGLNFTVSKDVLSPRPETELLVDFVLERSEKNDACKILDLGTGSGAITISILNARPKAVAVATDISKAALDVAKSNARTHGVEDRIVFKQTHWFDDISGQHDFIVSNPPYIDAVAMTELSKEVRDFDPELALSGGPDGLEAYRIIVGGVQNFLSPKGKFAVEIGFDQAGSVTKLFQQAGFEHINVVKDLAGHDRMVSASAAK